MKRFFSLLLIMALTVTGFSAGGISVSAAEWNKHISVTGFDPNENYAKAMQKALEDGSVYALRMGAIYEQQRNLKIDAMKLSQKKTSYFTKYTSAAQIKAAMEADKKPKYTAEELDLLSRIIYAEAGSSWIPDWVQRMVGSVVLNRVNSSEYPNTIRGVIYDPGQYSPTWNGAINKKPDARTIANAKYLLEHGSICPANVTGQSSAISGSGIYQTYHDDILGSNMYFCYN